MPTVTSSDQIETAIASSWAVLQPNPNLIEFNNIPPITAHHPQHQMSPPHLVIYCASDLYGSPLHQAVIDHLQTKHADDVKVINFGVYSKYYLAAHAVGVEVEKAAVANNNRPDSFTKGILICGSGQGMTVISNKFPHVYAALCITPEQGSGCRAVNNSNVLTLGANLTTADVALEIVDNWLTTQLGDGYEGDIHEFILGSMPEIEGLEFSATAKQAIADVVPPE